MRMGDSHLQQVMSRRSRREEDQEEGTGIHQQAKCLIGAGEGEIRSQRQVGRVWVSEEIEWKSLVVSVWRRRLESSREWWWGS